MSMDPKYIYVWVTIIATSMSHQIAGLPLSGPIGAVRVALTEGQWVAFPTHDQVQEATFDMVVAGRIVGDDTAIMMVEAEATANSLQLVAAGATAPTEEVVAQGLEAAKPFIRTLCEAQRELAGKAAKPTAQFPVFADYGEDVYAAVESAVSEELAGALAIAGKLERESELDRVKGLAAERLAEKFEGREKEV